MVESEKYLTLFNAAIGSVHENLLQLWCIIGNMPTDATSVEWKGGGAESYRMQCVRVPVQRSGAPHVYRLLCLQLMHIQLAQPFRGTSTGREATVTTTAPSLGCQHHHNDVGNLNPESTEACALLLPAPRHCCHGCYCYSYCDSKRSCSMGHVLRAFTSAAMPKHHEFKAIETVTPHVTNAGTPNLHPQVHRPLTTASSN